MFQDPKLNIGIAWELIENNNKNVQLKKVMNIFFIDISQNQTLSINVSIMETLHLLILKKSFKFNLYKYFIKLKF